MKKGGISLVVTTEILEEYEEQLSDFYSPVFADLVLKTLINLPELEEVTVYFKWNLIVNDPDDDKFVDAAVACNADYIVTHDGDFKVLRQVEFPSVKCITLKEFHVIHFGAPMPEPV